MPERVGPYRLVERLAAGGMGEVWRAWDERLKRPVAVKHVLSQLLSQEQARARFRREAEAGARLSHPAIVQIHDLVERPDGDWLVMELVEGQTLRQLLHLGPLPARQAARLASEIAQGLAAAHACGLLHRDLKAANVMITRDGHAKILDFGIAKELPGEAQEEREATLSRSGEVLGTSHAMSPEQALGMPLGPPSDLFSLGSLLYEMVTGTAPFRAETSAATLARVCSYQPLPARQGRPQVPAELSALIGRLLEKEPAARPGDAGEVATALLLIAALEETAGPPGAAAQAEETTQATVPEPFLKVPAREPVSTTLPGSRHTLAWSLGALAVGLLLVLGLTRYEAGLPPAPVPTLSTYELYERGLASLLRADRRGNLNAAIADFRQILAQDANHAPAHAALAHAFQLQSTGQKDPLWLEQALPLAERAVELDQHLASARVSLGLVYTSLGRLDEAARELERALQLEPLNADAHFGLAKMHEARTQLDEAEAAYQEALRRRPDRQFYDALGALYVRRGRLDQAVAAFQESIRLAPDSFIGYRNLGTAYYLQGDLARAASEFQKALEIESDPTLYSNLGTLYFAQGLYEQAVQAFEKALAEGAGANDYLLWGNLGDAYRWLPNSSEKAREAYSRALQLLAEKLRATPEDATLASRRALYLAKRGDCQPALAAGGEIERLTEIDAAALLRLTVAREVCGQRERALAALEAALRAGLPRAEVQGDPELLDLRSDVRYHRLMVKLAEPPATAF